MHEKTLLFRAGEHQNCYRTKLHLGKKKRVTNELLGNILYVSFCTETELSV